MFVDDTAIFEENVKNFNMSSAVKSFGAANSSSANIFIAEKGIDRDDKKRVVRMDSALLVAFREIETLKAEKEKNEIMITDLQKRIDEAWDVMSERVSDIEEKFQKANPPKKGITPWVVEHARRIYMDKIDENELTNPGMIPTFDQLDLDVQFEYIRKAMKNA